MGEHKRHRRRSPYRARLAHELRTGLTIGGIMAALYCLYAVGLFALRGAEPFTRNSTTLVAVLVVYAGGGLLGGAVYGIMHPLARSVIGAIAVGVVCATLIFVGIAFAVEGAPSEWTQSQWKYVGIAGLLFGVAGALIMRRIWRAT